MIKTKSLKTLSYFFVTVYNHKNISQKLAQRNSPGSCVESYKSRVIVPTLDTKVTEYLCSGGFFFSSDKFRLFN